MARTKSWVIEDEYLIEEALLMFPVKQEYMSFDLIFPSFGLHVKYEAELHATEDSSGDHNVVNGTYWFWSTDQCDVKILAVSVTVSNDQGTVDKEIDVTALVNTDVLSLIIREELMENTEVPND